MQAICIDWENAFYTVFHNKVLNVHTEAVSLGFLMMSSCIVFYSYNLSVYGLKYQTGNNNVKTVFPPFMLGGERSVSDRKQPSGADRDSVCCSRTHQRDPGHVAKG